MTLVSVEIISIDHEQFTARKFLPEIPLGMFSSPRSPFFLSRMSRINISESLFRYHTSSLGEIETSPRPFYASLYHLYSVLRPVPPAFCPDISICRHYTGPRSFPGTDVEATPPSSKSSSVCYISLACCCFLCLLPPQLLHSAIHILCCTVLHCAVRTVGWMQARTQGGYAVATHIYMDKYISFVSSSLCQEDIMASIDVEDVLSKLTNPQKISLLSGTPVCSLTSLPSHHL